MISHRLALAIAEIGRHIASHVADYYPHLIGQMTTLRRIRVDQRRFAVLCHYELSAPKWRQRLLAKLTLNADEVGSAIASDPVRSYFAASADPPGAEHAALSAFGRYVEAQKDPRLFSVRVLDSLMCGQGLLQEYADAKPLTNLLHGGWRNRTGRPNARVTDAMHRAGVCLRALHTMPVASARVARGARRDDFTAWAHTAEEFVTPFADARVYLRSLSPRLLRAAEEILPESFPLVPLHADYAPRNVLVDSQGRVAIIDMLEEWSGCQWEDVAQFLLSLSANKAQALTGGRWLAPATLATLRRTFLEGYLAGDRVPERTIALFEVRAAVTQWVTALTRSRERIGLGGIWPRVRMALSENWQRRYIESCLMRAEVRGPKYAASTADELSVAQGGAL